MRIHHGNVRPLVHILYLNMVCIEKEDQDFEEDQNGLVSGSWRKIEKT